MNFEQTLCDEAEAKGQISAALQSSTDVFRTFANVLDSSWLIILNSEGRIIFANQWVGYELGLCDQEIESNSILEILSPDHKDFMNLVQTEMVSDKTIYSNELSFLRENDDEIKRNVHLTKDGEEYYLWTSESDQLQADLLSTQGRVNTDSVFVDSFLKLIDDSPHHLFIRFSMDGTILSVSKGFENILGYSPEEVIGRSGYDFVHPEDIKKTEIAHAKILRGEDISFVIRRIHKNGHPIFVQICSITIEVNSKTMSRVIMSTEAFHFEGYTKTIDCAWELLIMELSHQLKEPCNIISNAMDTFRTPLTTMQAVLGFESESANHGHTSNQLKILVKEIEQIVNLIQLESEYLDSLMSDLIYFRQIKSGMTLLDEKTMETFSPNEEMKKIAYMYGKEMRDAHIDVNYKISRFDKKVCGHRTLIFGRVFHNLVSNSKKALLAANGVKSLTLTMNLQVESAEDVTFMFTVEDTGIGIKDEFQAKVFDSYLQYKEGKQITGMGLGLYIVKNIIEAMGGEIWVESKFGVFSRFSFKITLPISNDEVGIGFEVETKVGQGATETHLGPHPPATRIREQNSESFQTRNSKKGCTTALFADDHPSQRALMGLLLNNNGIESRIVQNGSEVIEDFERGSRYDAYILDYEMPGVAGPDAIKYLRNNGVESLIIGFTGKTNVDVQERFRNAGADLVFMKPFSMKKIIGEVIRRVGNPLKEN